MGAWDFKILSNDKALDAMPEIELLINSEEDLLLHIETMFSDPSIEVKLLAVGLVDLSINGMEKDILGNMYYEELYTKISKMNFSSLRGKALKTLEFVSDNDYTWIGNDCIEGRKKLLELLKERLN